MPSLKQAAVTRVFIPSTKNDPDENNRIWFDMKSNLLLSDLASFDEENQITQTLMLLHKLIADWNLTVSDDDDTKLPITIENIDQFGGQYISDFKFLSDWVAAHLATETGGLTTDEKKTSLSTSIPATEPIPPII